MNKQKSMKTILITLIFACLALFGCSNEIDDVSNESTRQPESLETVEFSESFRSLFADGVGSTRGPTRESTLSSF